MELTISIGALAAVTTCLIELIIVPLFELCRTKLSGFIANKQLEAGRHIYLRRSNPLMSYFGLGSITRFPSFFNKVVTITRSSLKVLIIISIVLWESQLRTGYRRTPITMKLGPDERSNTTIAVAAPIPVNPIFVQSNESCQNTFSLFSGSNCLGDRLLIRTPRLQTEYVKNCVELRGDRTVIYYAIATLTPSGRSVECLNGMEGTDKRILMTFSTLLSNTKFSKIHITSFNLSDDGHVDPNTRLGPYRVVMKTQHPFENRTATTYEGYLTFAGRTARDNNVGRSAYGVIISNKTGMLETVSIPITQGPNVCNGNVIGEWRSDKGEIYCPSGFISHKYTSYHGYHEMNLTQYNLDTQKKVDFTLEDALAWILETPIFLFNSYGGGTQEMRLRYTLMPLFFSYQRGKVLQLKTGMKHETTELNNEATILLICVLGASLLFCLISSVLYSYAVRRNNIRADFDDHNNLLSMWKDASESADMETESTPKLQWKFLDSKKEIRIVVWRNQDTRGELSQEM